VGTDKRIGQAFLNAGCGYGGSCFPKDIDAMIAVGESNGVSMEILKAVQSTNERQMQVIPRKIYKRFGTDLSNRTIAVWGLSFKPGTSDMRNASSLAIINALSTRNAKIVAYDPKAMSEAKANYFAQNSAVSFGDDPVSILKDADALLLITEWEEFKNPDFIQVKQLLKNPVIYDGRNMYSQEEMRSLGFEYYPIGKKCEGRNGF
jgi:UDPglucose 6-dehydrogenase